jgi:hypothetical protein
MSYEVSISTISLFCKSWTGAVRPIPVAISWPEAAWLLPAGDSIGGWRCSAEPVQHLPRRNENRLLQPRRQDGGLTLRFDSAERLLSSPRRVKRLSPHALVRCLDREEGRCRTCS